MNTQEIEALAYQLTPYLLTLCIGIVITLFFIFNRRKQVTTCPIPSQVIMDELQLLLADAFKTLSKDAFLKEAAKLYDTKYTLTKK